MAKKSYNGVVLPDITDVWLDYLYPYAFIVCNYSFLGVDTADYARLFVVDSSGYLKANEGAISDIVYQYTAHTGEFTWKEFVISLVDDPPPILSEAYPGINSEYWIPCEPISSTINVSEVHWTNTSLYDENSNLILAASKPVQPIDLNSWLTGFLYGICGKPLPMAQEDDADG